MGGEMETKESSVNEDTYRPGENVLRCFQK